MLSFDTLIVGAGPAGATAALNLAGTRRVLLVDRVAGNAPIHIGESLAPAARRLLTDMGLWPAFLAQGHAPCYANRAVWGSDEPVDSDLLRDPDGHGWHLDRARFDAWLRDVAASRGARCLAPAHVQSVEPVDTGWHVTINGQTIQARVLIDAAGRFAPIARRLGAIRSVDSKLICSWTAGSSGPSEAITFLEAVHTGWWYTAPLPGNRRILAFHTDSDLPRDAPIHRASHLARLLRDCHYQPESKPRVVVASGGMSAPPAGPAWFAAGDAAVRFDPLSAQGIFNALYTGLAAALAASDWLDGDTTAPLTYSNEIQSIFHAYRLHRLDWYRQENRWPGELFWSRRKKAGTFPALAS